MTPEDLAALHPRLYHVTSPGAWPQIRRHGLLTASASVDLFDPPADTRAAILADRRERSIPLEAPGLGKLEVNDQIPLSMKALATCLDNDLAPSDWLAMLNMRVFFWPSEDALDRLLSARMNRTRARDVLVFETLSLARAHAARLELCPINSGATIRKAARRGMATFTPLTELSYRDWRRRRGRSDQIVEVTLRGSLRDPDAHLVRIDTHNPVSST